jgi:hypothetical protein
LYILSFYRFYFFILRINRHYVDYISTISVSGQVSMRLMPIFLDLTRGPIVPVGGCDLALHNAPVAG